MFSKPSTTLEAIHPRNIRHLHRSLRSLVRGRLWLQVLIAMALGIGFGLLVSPDSGYFSDKTALAIGEWVALPGKLFLAFIQMIVVPLILASIIRGLAASSDMQQLKSTGLWLGIYFLATTVMAVVIGIALGLMIKPGSYISMSAPVPDSAEIRMIEQNALEAGAQTTQKEVSLAEVPEQITGILPTNPLDSMVQGDMLQIVIFAVIFGIGLLSVSPQSAKPLLELFGSVQQVCMAIVGKVMLIAPLAVFGLLAQAMIKTGPDVLAGLGVYAASVILGMIVLLGSYAVIVYILGGMGIKQFLKGIREPLLLAFSTNSSAATMPITVRSAERVMKIRPSISQFVIPLGATINMGGTALYQGLATIFMAQMFAIDLPLSALIALIATSLGASIGTPAVPGVGIIVLSSVLSSVGIPLSGLALIIGLDRILERFRASLNVTGDMVACVVMQRLVPSAISQEEEEIKEEQHEKQRWKKQEDVVLTD